MYGLQLGRQLKHAQVIKSVYVYKRQARHVKHGCSNNQKQQSDHWHVDVSGLWPARLNFWRRYAVNPTDDANFTAP